MIGFMSTIVPFIVISIFIIVIGVFIVTFATGIKTWHKNNNSPRLSVTATVVTKRDQLYTHHHHNNTGMSTSHSHSYYATFQFESGDRIELAIPINEFGLLADGDVGTLTFQGTRYISFVRS